jgi:hypothetical protein
MGGDEKKSKPKRKVVYPRDPVRHNPEKAQQKLVRQALNTGIVRCQWMERERFDYLCHMNLRSRLDKGPKYKKDDLKNFKDYKAVILKVLIPHCLEFTDVTPAEYAAVKRRATQLPHIRYKTCPCLAVQDVHMLPLPPLYPTLRVPTFQ